MKQSQPQTQIKMVDLQRELLEIGGDIQTAVGECIQTAHFTMGPQLAKFEQGCQTLLQTDHALGVANGTEALTIALKALNLAQGDEVITTPFTFFATAENLPHLGLVCRFADVDMDTMNISAKSVEALITPKTKAIIVVHIFGNPVNMDEILTLAKKHNIAVIEDAAQSFGATYNGQPTGGIGDIGTFSFYPTKNLGAYGDAGMVVTKHQHLADRVRSLRNHGSSPANKYNNAECGYNSRLDEIQGAVLNVKLPLLAKMNQRRRDIAALYRELLGDCVAYQVEVSGGVNIYHQFTIRVPNGKRDAVVEALRSNDIQHAIFYQIPLHLQDAFKYLGYKAGDIPNAEALSREVVSLPVHPYLTDEEVARVAKVVQGAL